MARGSTIPLAFSQESTLLAERTAKPGSINLGFRLPLGRQDIDAYSLRELWTNICTRQEALNARLVLTRSGMRQRFLDPSDVAAAAVDGGRDRASDSAKPYPGWRARPFRHSGPLFRSRVAYVDDAWAIDVALGHLVSDEWSLRVLHDEIQHELAAMRGAAGEPASGSLRTIIERQHRRFTDPGHRARYIDYWETQHAFLREFRLAAPMTTGPVVSAQRHTIAKFDVMGRPLETLRRARRRYNASDFMLLLAAVGVALRPMTDSDHLSLWTIVNTRQEPDDFAVVGCLITPVLLSLPLPRHPRVRDVVPQAQEALFTAMDYAAGPLEHRVPPVDVLDAAPAPPRIVMQWIPPQASAGRGTQRPLTHIHWSTRENVEDINLTFTRTDDTLRCEVGCRDDWMTQDAVRGFIYTLSDVLASL